jgi:hypothetical protein
VHMSGETDGSQTEEPLEPQISQRPSYVFASVIPGAPITFEPGAVVASMTKHECVLQRPSEQPVPGHGSWKRLPQILCVEKYSYQQQAK